MRAEVVGVLVGVRGDTPVVLAHDAPPRLPAGPLASDQRSLQASTRDWVTARTGRVPGYLEQLYTFADTARAGVEERTVSVCYLGLTRADDDDAWRDWYSLLPWEDHRTSPETSTPIAEQLLDWAGRVGGEEGEHRRARVEITFGLGENVWHPELVLQRYELMYEGGLIPESPDWSGEHGPRMHGDHRRILATGLARLRAKIEYRPVVFELLPDTFSLSELQRCVQAVAGQPVHTQNFRRTVDQQDLVEETGSKIETGGRPAKEYRFRRAVLRERQVSGTKLPIVRTR